MKVTSMSMHACMTSIHTLTQNVRYSNKIQHASTCCSKEETTEEGPSKLVQVPESETSKIGISDTTWGGERSGDLLATSLSSLLYLLLPANNPNTIN
jgi:hypothetical protein